MMSQNRSQTYSQTLSQKLFCELFANLFVSGLRIHPSVQCTLRTALSDPRAACIAARPTAGVVALLLLGSLMLRASAEQKLLLLELC
jgi:hypothetical protein